MLLHTCNIYVIFIIKECGYCKNIVKIFEKL